VKTKLHCISGLQVFFCEITLYIFQKLWYLNPEIRHLERKATIYFFGKFAIFRNDKNENVRQNIVGKNFITLNAVGIIWVK
jgi:hypothetical protein